MSCLRPWALFPLPSPSMRFLAGPEAGGEGRMGEEDCNVRVRRYSYLDVHSAIARLLTPWYRRSPRTACCCSTIRSRWTCSPFSGQTGQWGAAAISLESGSGLLTGPFASFPSQESVLYTVRLAGNGSCEISAVSHQRCHTKARTAGGQRASCSLLRKIFSAG